MNKTTVLEEFFERAELVKKKICHYLQIILIGHSKGGADSKKLKASTFSPEAYAQARYQQFLEEHRSEMEGIFFDNFWKKDEKLL